MTMGPHADALKLLNKQQKIEVRKADGGALESGALTCSTMGGRVVRFPTIHPTAELAQPMLASVPCPMEVSEVGGLTEAGDKTEASGAGEGERGLKIVLVVARRGGKKGSRAHRPMSDQRVQLAALERSRPGCRQGALLGTIRLCMIQSQWHQQRSAFGGLSRAKPSATYVVRSALQHTTPGAALAGGHGAIWLHQKITGLPITAGQKAASTCVHVQIAGRTSNGSQA